MTGAMPCARVPETRLSTPVPDPGRPPVAATLIRPGGNLEQKEEESLFPVCQQGPVLSWSAFTALTCRQLH